MTTRHHKEPNMCGPLRLRKLDLLMAFATFAAAFSAGCTTAPIQQEEEEQQEEQVQQEPVEEAPKPLEFETIYFDYNKTVLKESAKAALKRAVDQLLARPEAKVTIEGHCDERGTDQYNLQLGWKRAYATRDYLKRLGIDESRLYPISYGRARPAVEGNDESAWSRNRRAVLTERP